MGLINVKIIYAWFSELCCGCVFVFYFCFSEYFLLLKFAVMCKFSLFCSDSIPKTCRRLGPGSPSCSNQLTLLIAAKQTSSTNQYAAQHCCLHCYVSHFVYVLILPDFSIVLPPTHYILLLFWLM